MPTNPVQHCVTHPDTHCVECDAVASVTAVPDVIVHGGIAGWNAGANSILQMDGHVHVRFPMPTLPAGIVVGFKHSRNFQTMTAGVEFGIYFTQVANVAVGKIIERGVPVGIPFTYSTSNEYEIRRAFGVVTYWEISSAGTVFTLLHTSTVPSIGPLLVNSCLYFSGDTVP